MWDEKEREAERSSARGVYTVARGAEVKVGHADRWKLSQRDMLNLASVLALGPQTS